MDSLSKVIGWQIHHTERLQYRTKSGSPIIRLKFYHYPDYRQKVQIISHPLHCKVRNKGNNSYFLFNHKVNKKGTLSLKRIVRVIPTLLSIKSNNWGKISNYSSEIQQKYQESSEFWPVRIPRIQGIAEQEWFKSDSLFDWVKRSYFFLNKKIPFRENQEERIGALKALLSGTGDCDEFTDSFITLARRKGIPCRRLTGLFITKSGNSVEPHAWAEIFSQKLGWITIDVALNNVGNHTVNYITLKIEEFNPELPDYQIETKHSSVVHYQWERTGPSVIPIY